MNTTLPLSAKSGYTIVSTPGIKEDGSWPLASDALLQGKVARAFAGEEMALFASEQDATAAMQTLCPEGVSPAAYAGLSVRKGWLASEEHMTHGWVRGHGFEPVMEPLI